MPNRLIKKVVNILIFHMNTCIFKYNFYPYLYLVLIIKLNYYKISILYLEIKPDYTNKKPILLPRTWAPLPKFNRGKINYCVNVSKP